MAPRAIFVAVGLACAATSMVSPAAASTARPPQPTTLIRLHPAIGRPAARFEGWGTALAWFAEVTGNWPDPDRQRLADLLYGPAGLGWTIARYNIGGGNPSGLPPYLRPGAAIPGFWRNAAGSAGQDWWDPENPAMWDWSADGSQRWWLDAIAARVPKPIFEAFSNSPPWFMTRSGRVSGSVQATEDNLRPGQEAHFATYLARVVDELQRRHHITFRTLSPFNEPNTDYWFATNRQEGAHWSPARQATMIEWVSAALQSRQLDTRISAPDETNSHKFLEDWAAYSPTTRRKVGQINVHSYGTVRQTAVRDLARTENIRLWMSENDTSLDQQPEDLESMAPAIAFAEHVVLDLKRLQPAAWIFWQAVEDLSARDGAKGSNWGLIKADLRAPATAAHPLHITTKYWAMAQFSRFIRPGYRLIPVDDLDTVGALAPGGRKMVLVHVNGGPLTRRLSIALHGWSTETVIVTDATRHAKRVADTVAPPASIVTLILNRRP